MLEASTNLSLGQAARLTGLGKTTLSRAIKAGRLSATRNETGGYSIDAAELSRVFPVNVTPRDGAAPVPVAHHATADAILAEQVAALREMLAMAKAENVDLRHDRDQWRDQARQLLLAPPKPVETPPAPPAPRWRWWRRAAG